MERVWVIPAEAATIGPGRDSIYCTERGKCKWSKGKGDTRRKSDIR